MGLHLDARERTAGETRLVEVRGGKRNRGARGWRSQGRGGGGGAAAGRRFCRVRRDHHKLCAKT
jgi:hypothetical protein